MLRQASTKPVQEEGGDVGADDDDDEEDESESEADETKAGDSEDEDAGTSSRKEKGKGKEKEKGKGLSALDRLKGKKSTAASSPLKIATVQEEDSSVPKTSPGLAMGTGKPPKTSPSLFERRASKSPQLAQGGFPLPQASPPLADVPEGRPINAASEASNEPTWSIGDKPKTQSIWTRFGTPSKTPASTGGDGYFGSQPSSSNATAHATPAAAAAAAAMAAGGKDKGRESDNGQTLSPGRAAPVIDTPSDIGTREGDDSEDEGDAEGTEENAQATAASSSAAPLASPTRPGLYTQASQSLVNLRPRGSHDASKAQADEAPVLAAKPPLITIPSGEEVGTRPGPPKIDLPKGPFSMIGRIPQTPGWAKPPPTPATPGAASRVFWAANKGKDPQAQLKRRRSADDLTGVPPTYTPPPPGVYVPKPREDEGRERLPDYWCAVSIPHVAIEHRQLNQ
jgi:hypothetical protein